MPTHSSTTLSGQVATPFSVSGVTAPPSEMPISTKTTRASGVGIVIGRPGQRGDGDGDHRSGQKSGRNAGKGQRAAADGSDQQRFAETLQGLTGGE